MDAYREMTHSNQAWEDNALFAGIDVYDGEDPSKFEGWLDAIEQACNMTDRNLCKELMKKSAGAIREMLLMMSAAWTDDDIISKLRQDFSSVSTMNRAREELKDLKQLPCQPISSYMYKYGRIHFLATGNQARNERYPTAIMEFIKSLNPKLMRALAKKHADPRTRPQMLQQAFNMAEEVSRWILETESFERSSTVRFVGTVNNIYQHESEINEVSCGRYNNSNYKGGYNNNRGNNSYKGKNNYYGKKDWNKNSKGSYQKKEEKKESKDKDVYLTLTKDVKFCCPAGFNENIFACACKMIQEKVNSARQAGVTDIKTINAVEKDNFMRVFNFPEDVYNSTWAQATGEEDPASSGDTSNWLQKGYTPENYLSSGSSVYTIDTGKSRGTTFKIDTGGYVFSCLFDSGAEISCMNMETIATLGLTSQITPSSVSVNTANGDHMGVAGDVRVHFKIGKKCSFTHNFVVCERLSWLFIIGEDFMRKHYMSLQWVPENKHALGFQGETIAVASQAILDEPLRLKNAIRIPPRSTVMAPGYCNQMFSGKAAAVPCAELKQRFPNLYMEPMQMNNSENKSYNTIP